MPKFHLYDLPLININNDYHIELDNIPYNEHESYTKVSIISFTNKYGHVILKGFFDLTNKNIPSLIIINKLSFEISKQLLNSCTYNFCKYILEIEFYFSYDDITLLKNIEKYLINEYNCSIDYNNKKIYILLNEIKNINIYNKIRGNIEEEESINNNYINIIETRKKIKNIDDDKIIQFQFNKIKMNNNNNNENIQNEEIIDNIDDTLNNVEMEDMSKLENPFTTHLSEKTEEKKINTISEDNINMGINVVKRNYIKSINGNNSNNLVYDNKNEIYLNKIINPKINNHVNTLISNGALFMKNNLKTNILNSININGLYLLLNNNNDKYGNNYKFTINKLILNNDIDKEGNEISDYKKIIFNNFINILDNVVKSKKNNNLNINEYTNVILSYISQIQNKVDDIEKKQNKTIIDNNYLEKYKKIISTLKLFCILFLNCFMYKPENEYINDPNLFTNSFSDKVMSYRKRLLIEWCIDEQKKYNLEKNNSKININNNNENENDIKTNYEKLYSFGQIKKDIDNQNNKKISLFIRAKMSNNNERILKNNMYYFTGYNILHGESNREFRDIFVDKYNNDWLSFLVQSLLYEEKRDEYIVYSIELLSKNIYNMNIKARPIINVNNTQIHIYDINFILLKLYEKYIKGEINEQIKYLKMLSYSCNINNNNSSDHFIQYIICSTLLKILPIIFPKDEQINYDIIDNAFIKKITYNLLIQSIEELLINSSSINNIDNNGNNLSIYEYYTEAIKLILLSFLNKKTKNKLIDNIISKINISLESLNAIEESNPLSLTENQKYSLLGYVNNSLCLWKDAYNCFISAREYKYALDACINYAVEHIKKYNENSDFKEILLRLNEIKKNMPTLFVDIYQIIFLFIKYMNDNKKNTFGLNDISSLLNEFSSKDKYLCPDLIDDDIRGIIIDLLYNLLIKKNRINFATGNSELIVEKYVKMNTELNMMLNSFWDNVKSKNNIFS